MPDRTNYLSAINWGTGTAETTTTLGAHRADTRIPPDVYTVSGLQLRRHNELLISLSEYGKGGNRWRILPTTANQFSAGEYGLQVNNPSGSNYVLQFAVNGTTLNHVAAAPLTTKGDMIAYTGTIFERLAVGADNRVLTASAAASGGWAWSLVSLTASVTGVLPVANGGTNSAAALNNSRIMVSAAGAVVEAGALTNGQLLIGSTGAAPVVASLTAGTGISITPGAGSISIAATTGGETLQATYNLGGAGPQAIVVDGTRLTRRAQTSPALSPSRRTSPSMETRFSETTLPSIR